MNVMNIGILAHVDAGKTTLTESMLLHGGVISSAGRVDAGTTTTDSMELERKRGITIRSTSVSLCWKDVKINLLDTPGHVDFIAEVERSLRVLDGAVLVLSAKEGVQVQTRVLFQALARLNIPTLLYLNKLDRAGVDLPCAYAQIHELLTPNAIPLQRVRDAGFSTVSLAEELPDQELLQNRLLNVDEILADQFLSELPLTERDYEAALCRCVQNGSVYPLYHGAALKGLGTPALLDAIIRLLPCFHSLQNEEEPSARIFQIFRDPKLGRLACLKLSGGQLSVRSSLSVSGCEAPVKLRHLYHLEQGRIVPAETVSVGDIALIANAPELKIGTALGNGAPDLSASLGLPTLETAVTATDPADRAKLIAVLTELTDEDPFLASSVDPVSGEISVRIFGEVQLEILNSLILERYGLAVSFGSLNILYQERPAGIGTGLIPIFTAPNPYYATVGLELSPLPAGAGLQFETRISFGYLTPSFQSAVREGVEKAVLHGLLGYPVTDLQVVFQEAVYSSPCSAPADFRKLTPFVFEQALQRAGTILMEPMLRYTLRVPSSCGGKAAFDLREMRGSIETIDSVGAELSLSGRIPAQTCGQYPARLSAYTNGLGIFLTQSDGYADYTGNPPRRPYSQTEEESKLHNLFHNAGWLN